MKVNQPIKFVGFSFIRFKVKQMKGGKMKKNLIFGISLVLVVLMASGVFAGLFGLTGNALRTGERIAQDSSLTIKGIEDNKVRIGNEIYSQGETFSDSGKIYEVRAIEKKAWFLGSDKVVVEEVEPIEPKIPVELCTDSDGGLDYYVKGTRTSQEGTYSDTCRPSTAISDTSNYSSGKYLLELYCEKKKYTDGVKLEVASEFYECPNGCKEGACVGEEPTSEVTYEGVLKMLKNAEVLDIGNDPSKTCNDICEVKGFDCIFAITNYFMWDLETSSNFYSQYLVASLPVSCEDANIFKQQIELDMPTYCYCAQAP